MEKVKQRESDAPSGKEVVTTVEREARALADAGHKKKKKKKKRK